MSVNDWIIFSFIVILLITSGVSIFWAWEWKRRHDEAVEMWEQESKIKTDKIVELKAKLENDERYDRVIKIEQVHLEPKQLECMFHVNERFVEDTEMFKRIVISETARYLAEELERDPYLCTVCHSYNSFDCSEKIKVRFRMLPYAEGVIWDDLLKKEEE